MNQDRIETFFVVRHSKEEGFLILSTEDGWELPKIDGGIERDGMVGPLQLALREQLCLKVWIWRKLFEINNETTNMKKVIYEAEICSSQDLIPNARWINKDDIAILISNCKKFGDVNFYQLLEITDSDNIAPWFFRGWYDAVQDWIKCTAESKKININGEIEQVKISDLCAIMRIPTVEGSLYFKATVPAAAHEAVLSKQINMLFKEKSADIIDIDENKGWILMRDIKGQPLRELREKSLWQRAIQEYAKLQLEETQSIEDLISMGVPDRRLSVLKAEIDKHLSSMCATGLNEVETLKIIALKSELLKMCDEMEGIIPYSIDHGDLHSANIRLVDEKIVFFDWGDAAVTHPFFSTRIFWNSIDDLIKSESEWLNMVNEFKSYYLAPWTKYAQIDQLERLLLISDQLSCVYRALGWHLYINPNRENIEDSYNKPAQWLQVLLEHRSLLGLQ